MRSFVVALVRGLGLRRWRAVTAGNEGGDGFGGGGVDLVEERGVGVGGDLDPGMTQQGRDQFEVLGDLVGQGRGAVAEVVKPDRWQRGPVKASWMARCGIR
jgi:hypothetical protein